MMNLQEMARQSLLRDNMLAIAALKDLPIELFPQLFLDAYAQRCTEVLKAMVPVWPFPCLPLGALLHDLLPGQMSFEAVLDGLDMLLTQKVQPRRCKLQTVDFRNTGQKFWNQWCGIDVSLYSRTRGPLDEMDSRKEQSLAPLVVVIELWVTENHMSTIERYIINWVKGKRDLHLCCRNLTFIDTPMQNKFLKMIQLDCIQETEIRCFWNASTLRPLAPLLGKMSNLQRFSLAIHKSDGISPKEMEEREQFLTQLIPQFLKLHSLREIYLDSPVFLEGRLDQMFRCMIPSLETLSITDCRLLESDLIYLSQCPNITQLKELCLRSIPLSHFAEPLQFLLKRCSATLQNLDLGLCGLLDTHLETILPTLSLCSQLRILNFYGNRLSKAMAEKLLHHTSGLPSLSLEVYPAPLESYSPQGVLHTEIFRLVCTELLGVLRNLEYPRSILLSTGTCTFCGQTVFYNWEPVVLPGYCCKFSFTKICFDEKMYGSVVEYIPY